MYNWKFLPVQYLNILYYLFTVYCDCVLPCCCTVYSVSPLYCRYDGISRTNITSLGAETMRSANNSRITDLAGWLTGSEITRSSSGKISLMQMRHGGHRCQILGSANWRWTGWEDLKKIGTISQILSSSSWNRCSWLRQKVTTLAWVVVSQSSQQTFKRPSSGSKPGQILFLFCFVPSIILYPFFWSYYWKGTNGQTCTVWVATLLQCEGGTLLSTRRRMTLLRRIQRCCKVGWMVTLMTAIWSSSGSSLPEKWMPDRQSIWRSSSWSRTNGDD